MGPFAKSVHNDDICAFKQINKGVCKGDTEILHFMCIKKTIISIRKGDSGGALVNGALQIGVVSWVINCAAGYPDVFTSVAAHRSWIRKNTGV